MINQKNNLYSKIQYLTLLILSRNRGDFLLRTLDYYEKELGFKNFNVIITDGSDEDNYRKTKKNISQKKYNLKITHLHHPPDAETQKYYINSFGKKILSLSPNERDNIETPYGIVQRFAKATALIKTPYVIITADDDFYFTDYLIKGIDFLENNGSYGTVYGHLLRFQLDKYVAKGKIISANISPDNNPPNPWLEDESVETRIMNLGKTEWAWFGWYAIQRTSLLKLILEYSIHYKIYNNLLFEKFMSFCQTVLYKSKKLDIIFCARQDNLDVFTREPYSFKKNKVEINGFISSCASFLSIHKSFDTEHARSIVVKAVSKDIEHYKRSDRKRILRLLRNKFKIIRKIQNMFDFRVYPNQDPRFPPLPDIKLVQKKIEYINQIVNINNNFRIAKVIATSFTKRKIIEQTSILGDPPGFFYHSQNFTSTTDIINLLKFQIELEEKCNAGAARDLIIVNSDANSKKGNQFIDEISGTNIPGGKIICLTRKNIGRSFGAYSDAFLKFKDDYDFFLFSEDDMIIAHNNYLKTGLEMWHSNKKCGFVAYVGISKVQKNMWKPLGLNKNNALTCYGGCGLSSTKVLNEVVKKHGFLPHYNGIDWYCCILHGEIAFPSSIASLGYVLVESKNEVWAVPAYDKMRRIPYRKYPKFTEKTIYLFKRYLYKFASQTKFTLKIYLNSLKIFKNIFLNKSLK